jgi:hypothetical protein
MSVPICIQCFFAYMRVGCMVLTIPFLIQIVVSLFSGMLLLTAFLYFLFLKKVEGGKQRYFILFLGSFSLYLLGRCLQILFEWKGMSAASLLVNAVRLTFLCSLSMPALLLMTHFLAGVIVSRRQKFIFALGGFFAAGYCAMLFLVWPGLPSMLSLEPVIHFSAVIPK